MTLPEPYAYLLNLTPHIEEDDPVVVIAEANERMLDRIHDAIELFREETEL